MPRDLKRGDEVNGYRLTSNGTTAGSGTAQWAFATKGGHEYFLKQFLSPVYPLSTAPGTPEGKAKRRARCDRFQQRMERVEGALGVGGDGGFLVRAVDLFWWRDGIFYKVTEKVERAGIDPADVSNLDAAVQWLVVTTVSYGLRMLHEHPGLVHADLKPDNILLQGHREWVVAKLIDFDASFFESDPPATDDILGDQVFQAPEMIRYLTARGASTRPSQAIDVFAAGLIFHQYVTGVLPVGARDTYPGAILLTDASLRLSPPRSLALAPLMPLIAQMLAANPASRPTMRTVHETVRSLRGGPTLTPPAPPVAKSFLRFGSSRSATARETPPSPPKPEPPPPTLPTSKLRMRGFKTKP